MSIHFSVTFEDDEGNVVQTIDGRTDSIQDLVEQLNEVDPSATDKATVPITADLLLDILEKLRLAPIYVLKDKHPEEMPEDFKPWKWDGYEIEFAREAYVLHEKLQKEMLDALGGGE